MNRINQRTSADHLPARRAEPVARPRDRLWIDRITASAPANEATPTPLPTPIIPEKPVYTVQVGTVVQTLEFTGRASPVLEQELFFETSGNVGEVFVARGDWVQAGDVLAELDIDDLQKQLSQKQHQPGNAAAQAGAGPDRGHRSDHHRSDEVGGGAGRPGERQDHVGQRPGGRAGSRSPAPRPAWTTPS